jgi:DNA-binding response OmpR family regulator
MPSESSKKDLFDQSVEISTGRLLVVDDELDLLAALTQMLQKQGYEVSGCSSAEEALSALQEQDFDLLLTDLMMPKLSGPIWWSS